ncbi:MULTISPECIES: hypothetical protein [Myxococcus]|nr:MULTISPECIES: hypothetical protein [Myxococcus]
MDVASLPVRPLSSFEFDAAGRDCGEAEAGEAMSREVSIRV